MKSVFLFLSTCFFASLGFGQAKDLASLKPDPGKKVQTVDAACGKCQLGLKGKSCELAVRIDGKAYYVDGFKIDDFGDAHGSDGFCNAVRKADVQGELVKGRFKASYFKLLPEEHKN